MEKFHFWVGGVAEEIAKTKNQNYMKYIVTEDDGVIEGRFRPTENATIGIRLEDMYDVVLPDNCMINFKDPWKVDFQDEHGLRSQGAEAELLPYPAPLSLTTSSSFKGVFVNTDPLSIIGSYSVSAENQLTAKGKTWKFSHWNGSGYELIDPASAQSKVVFKTPNASIKACYKGIQVSNNSETFANNSQRKIIKSSDGYLHMVYESMNNVWYEMSTDNGVTWAIMNNGKGLSTTLAGNPALAFQHKQTDYVPNHEIVIVYEENNSGLVNVVVKTFRKDNTGFYNILPQLVSLQTSEPFPQTTNPVVSCGLIGETFVVWRDRDLFGINHILRAAYLDRFGTDKILTYVSSSDIPNSGPNPMHHAIGSSLLPTEAGPGYFRIVWDNYSESIHYIELEPAAAHPYISFRQNSYKVLAAPDDPAQYSPSIMNGSARVIWVAENTMASPPEKTVVFRDPGNPYLIWYFGSNVSSPTITEQANGTYFIAWSQNESGTMKNYWVDNLLSAANVKRIKYLNTADVQITNSGTPTTCMAIGLGGQQAPYSFVTKPLVQTNNQNTTDFPVATAISGTVSYPETGGINFDYTLGDISVDGSLVSFAEAAPDITFNTLTEMNQYLISQPFGLNNSSEFFYSIVCIPSHSTEYVQQLFQNGGSLNFTVQLVDASNDEIIGTYDNVTFDAANTGEFRNIMFDVDCAGIGTRMVKLRLTISSTAAGAEPLLGSYIVPLPEGQIEKMLSKVKEDRISFWRNNGAVAKKTATIKKVTFNGKALKGSGA
ncbi:MAG: hypothetical protein HY965_05060, partial [Ignavibacteriales bacterium]|nr:hypothetical protein [Ignavibacteriales bacterium]